MRGQETDKVNLSVNTALSARGACVPHARLDNEVKEKTDAVVLRPSRWSAIRECEFLVLARPTGRDAPWSAACPRGSAPVIAAEGRALHLVLREIDLSVAPARSWRSLAGVGRVSRRSSTSCRASTTSRPVACTVDGRATSASTR